MNIIPFSDFWYDCKINNDLSVLCSYDASYKKMMLANDYTYYSYYREDAESNFLGLNLFPNKTNQEYLDSLNYTAMSYQDKNNILNELKSYIEKDTIVCPKVDLYYWNRFGAAYHDWTAYHFSMLVGYDNSLHEFMALEDHADATYEIISEGEASLLEGIQSILKQNVPGPDYFILQPKVTKPYSLSMGELVENALAAKASILTLHAEDFFNFKKEILQVPKVTHLQAIVISKIITRMNANKSLIHHLSKMGLLSEQACFQLCTILHKIADSYCIIKNTLLKCEFSLEKFQNNYSFKMARYLSDSFSNENKFWDLLLREISGNNASALIYP